MAISGDMATFILNEADETDLQRMYVLIRERRRVLGQINASQVNRGDTVTLTGLSPKALNGLIGEVETITGKRCDVRLSLAATNILSAANTRVSAQAAWSYGQGEGYLLCGVPLTCAKVMTV